MFQEASILLIRRPGERRGLVTLSAQTSLGPGFRRGDDGVVQR
jgi:hypothetical protein